jgi:biopolymer transport protein ExbB
MYRMAEVTSRPAAAQDAAKSDKTTADDQQQKLTAAETRAQAALTEPEKAKTDDNKQAPVVLVSTETISVWNLYWQGGSLMYPITFMSFLVVVFGAERLIGLRRNKVLPNRLIRELRNLAAQPTGLDPRHAYKICQQYPSAAANVVRALLLKVGRPTTEVEHTVAEANEREANRLYSNVRWLNLSASVTPLMGLLGTVQGMIMAFFVTAHLPTGANRAESLAQGIYVALVTTFGGLTVAIPAAILAHFFEGRIQSYFRELDDTIMDLLPQIERFEGRVRVRHEPSKGGEHGRHNS